MYLFNCSSLTLPNSTIFSGLKLVGCSFWIFRILWNDPQFRLEIISPTTRLNKKFFGFFSFCLK